MAALTSRTLLHLPLSELLLQGVLDNRGMILVTTVYGLLWQAGLFQGAWDRMANGWYGPGLVRDTIGRVAAGELLPWGQITVVLVGIVGLLVFIRVVSMIWSALRLYEFRLSRVGEDLRTEYGLLTRVTATIPLRRVQTLTIREAPLQRLVKRMSVRVETAGGHGSPEAGPGNLASGSRRSFDGPPCLPSCAKSFLASMWKGSTGIRCIRGHSAGR